MSKPPTVRKSKLELPDPEHHLGQKELYRALRQVIIDLRSLMTKGDDIHMMIEFANVINPGSIFDEGRLPLASEHGKSGSQRYGACILARVSQVVMAYWHYKLAEESEAKDELKTVVQRGVRQLRQLQQKGLVKCEVIGDEKQGFELVLS